MDIILVHLGPQIPPYLFWCIKQIRNVCDNRIILILSERQNFTITSDNVITVFLDAIPKCETYKNFNHDFFKDMGLPLWRYACERFFAIESVMKHFNIDKAMHIENDNLIYAKPDEEFLERHCGPKIGLTQITKTLISAGVMYIGSYAALRLLNEKLNELIALGTDELIRRHGNEMLNEMRLLQIIYDGGMEIIKLLPIFPTEGSAFVYDCASWGQYVDGTYQVPGIPYREKNHLIGEKIINGAYGIGWYEKDEKGNKWPAVFESKLNFGRGNRLFNLHIHSKRLEKWMSK